MDSGCEADISLVYRNTILLPCMPQRTVSHWHPRREPVIETCLNLGAWDQGATMNKVAWICPATAPRWEKAGEPDDSQLKRTFSWGLDSGSEVPNPVLGSSKAPFINRKQTWSLRAPRLRSTGMSVLESSVYLVALEPATCSKNLLKPTVAVLHQGT